LKESTSELPWFCDEGESCLLERVVVNDGVGVDEDMTEDLNFDNKNTNESDLHFFFLH